MAKEDRGKRLSKENFFFISFLLKLEKKSETQLTAWDIGKERRT